MWSAGAKGLRLDHAVGNSHHQGPSQNARHHQEPLQALVLGVAELLQVSRLRLCPWAEVGGGWEQASPRPTTCSSQPPTENCPFCLIWWWGGTQGSSRSQSHLSWFISMLTMSLKQSGSMGEKKPLPIWSTACLSSGRRS